MSALTVDVHNDLAELERLATIFLEFAAAHHLPDAVRSAGLLALEEVVTNVIRHGYADSGPHTFRVHLAVDADALVVRVEDDARPYNPLARPDPNVELPLEDRPIGGLGIFLVRRLMDSVDYSRRDGMNILVMKKCRQPPDRHA